MATESKGRLYVVQEHDDAGKVLAERLIRAGTAASAIRHVVLGKYDAHAAKSDDVARLMAKGVTVSDAGAE